MNEITLALRWYLTVQSFGLAALPLARRLFRHLPDQGYGASKALGLLLAGWAFWIMATLGWLHNTAGGVVVALAIVAAAGFAVHILNKRPSAEPARRFSWGAILTAEAVFVVAFAAWCVVRAHMPRIETAGGEKWMEIAFLRAILRSEAFPPHDPWLSGFAISYYYFGYIVVAMVTQLSAVPPSIAFNLAGATLFALTCAGAFSLVYSLVALDRRGQKRSAVLSGLLGPLLVAVVGNLEGLLEVLHARGIGSASFWKWLDIIKASPISYADGTWTPQRFYWWWQASRVIRDYTPWGAQQEVIDEFPGFSFLLGDMHPHVLALPFVLLALALALNIYRRASLQPDTLHLRMLRWTISLPLEPWELVVYAVCLGGLGFLNTWDFPIYLFVVAGAYALGRARGAEEFKAHAVRFGSMFGALLLPGVVLYLPFWLTFQSQAGGVLPNLFNGTRLHQFLVMFGPLIFVVVAYVTRQARRADVQFRRVAGWTLLVTLGALGTMLLISGAVLGLIQWGVISSEAPPGSYIADYLRGESVGDFGHVPGVWALVRNRFLLDPEVLSPSLGTPPWVLLVRSVVSSPLWTTLVLLALVVTAFLMFQRGLGSIRHSSSTEPPKAGSQDFVLLLFATGALLTLSVEYVYLKDHFYTRMNTVFKFYFQTWVLWAIAGAYALSAYIRNGKVLISAVAVLLIAAGLIYPILAIPSRAEEQGGLVTLDGASYLAQVRPNDYAAIEWLNDNVVGAPTILEAPGHSYDYEGRVSAHTGLPTVLGWAGHEGQWRGDYQEQSRREPDIEAIYTSVDANHVLALLDRYNVSYVYVGSVERGRYPEDGVAKFAGLLDTVYDTGSVTIYQVSR